MSIELLVILALVLANGVLAGAEIAVIAMRPGRLKELAAEGRRAAQAALELREKPERFFATVQVGITVVGATASAFGGATLADDLALVLARVEPLAPIATQLSLALVVTLVSYLSLVLGELVPKSLAMKGAETYTLIIARPLLGLARVFRPLIWFLTASSNVVLRPFKDRTSFTEARLSPDELAELVSEATSAGTLDRSAGEIATRALALPTLVASDVMVPRTEVVALRRGMSPQEVRRVLLEHTHSRFPVVAGDLDHVVGYVSTKDIITLAWEEQLFVLEDLLRPVFFVPPGKRVVELLAELRERHLPFCVVVDEHGGMAGIVTLEDVLEELVGEIFSEHARTTPPLFTREADGSVLVQGTTALRDVNRELGLKLPEGEWVTVAGLCLSLARRIPKRGERFDAGDGVTLEVVDASPRRVRLVRVRATPD
ncbi:MAG: hemolysin family protein [Myxococcota bacterium]